MKPRSMIVAGIMSGTSADGIDIALCRIGGESPRLKLMAHRAFPYSANVRAAVLAAMNAEQTSTAELARLHWRLGALYADAVEKTQTTTGLRAHLIALHGQTIYHQATGQRYLGADTRATWQIGEASVLAERLRVPVISDFRPADLAAGGQGAPLVPMLDYTLFRNARRNRILLNLGGIANLTAIPAGGSVNSLLAFDTGPANMLIDTLMERVTGRSYDRNGAFAAKGQVLLTALEHFLSLPYFQQEPPKSCGREQFGPAFAQRFLDHFKGTNEHDLIATATALTTESIRAAYQRFVWPHLGQKAPLAIGTDLLVAGGGARNATLMRMLAQSFEPLGIHVSTTADKGLPIEAKEAAAFALLGWLTWHQRNGNAPSATGASRPVLLGKVTYA
ncbi:MAG: anhydro-N-acetylmuramic acid kinase [Acidobacteriaceae bacterium]|nr:anhydro-N-acetylmuramic acid kinase [Acidobacteriaceae bacterium]